MYRTKIAALLVSTSLLTGAALAQAPTTPAPDTMQGSGVAAVPTGKTFVTEQAATEFRASKFAGLDIYGPDNEKIGDVVEILVDGSGSARSIVIGVGGFLGIGQKNVAVPWSAVAWSNDRPATRSASSAPMTTGSTTPATNAAPMTAGSPAATSPTAPARSPAEQAAYNGYPDHGTVRLTKAELQDAPAFRYYADTHSSSGGSTNAAPATSARP